MIEIVRGNGEVEWVEGLIAHVTKHGLAVFQFSDYDWTQIEWSRRGNERFTVARPHAKRSVLRAPTACLIIGHLQLETVIRLGIVETIHAVATLESRFKVVDTRSLYLRSDEEVVQLVSVKEEQANLRSAMRARSSLTCLGSEISGHLIQGLSRDERNWRAMRAVANGMWKRRGYSTAADLESDAVVSALKVFGVSLDDEPYSVYLSSKRESALERIRISEDSVIEQDAKVVNGFQLAESDLTGKAVFIKNDEVLEVITANRRPLEQVLGVDLIYVNASMRNVVMVQYKMLEPVSLEKKTDWIFRPDAQFRKELARMRRFSVKGTRQLGEYRINDEIFYLKFVKRDAVQGRAPIIMPMAHFEQLEKDPASKGPRGGFRVSYETLNRRYLRQDPFLGLVRSGYIGTYADRASAFTSLINRILRGDKAIVAALQSKR